MFDLATALSQAVQWHQAGRLAEAENLYRAILEQAPGQADALHLLGLLAHQAGRHAEAIDLISRALKAYPEHPVFHSNLAAVLLATGQLAEAEAHSREALRLRPDYLDALYNLSAALRRLGRLDEAEITLGNVLRRNPQHVHALADLGAVLQRQGRLPDALRCLREVVSRVPEHAQARNDLGAVLILCGQPAEAEEHLREALRLRPDFAEAHSHLGLALRDLGRFDDAMRCYREAIRLKPAYTNAHNNLGDLLEVQGRLEEAAAAFREARRHDPHNAVAILCLARLAAVGHHRFDDEELRAIQAQAERTDLPTGDRYRLHFALARLHDHAGAHDSAFHHCRQANELRQEFDCRRGLAFDPAVLTQFVDRLIVTFTPAYFERVRSFGVHDDLPVFIVGMPRSGTTLAEQIIASHPRVHGAGELNEMDRLIVSMVSRLGNAMAYPECMERLDGSTVRALGAEYLQRLRQLHGTAERVIDKMPFNFLNLGFIATLFPRARIIHCRRDPVDTCLSCYFQNFADRHPFTLDLRHLGHYYREYQRLMAHWERVLPSPAFPLEYEALTADQEAVSRRLLEFCGLPGTNAVCVSTTRRGPCGPPALWKCGVRCIAAPSVAGSGTRPTFSRCSKHSVRFREVPNHAAARPRT